MISIRYAPQGGEPGKKTLHRDLYAPDNTRLPETPPRDGETNAALFARLGALPGDVVLLGGSTLEHFRVRVAQAHVRTDLLPSRYSLAGVVGRDGRGFWTVPLGQADVSAVPGAGGVRYCRFAEVDDPAAFPNAALLRFREDMRPLLDVVETQVERKALRTLVDVPALIVKWLAYVWGAGDSGNPLLEGHGVPSAVFVQAVAAVAELDLSPGLVTTSTCPESIAAAARFWERAYPGDYPSGSRCTRQPAAACVFEHEVQPRTGRVAARTLAGGPASARPSAPRRAKARPSGSRGAKARSAGPRRS